MRRLYADKLVVISAVLIVLFSALFARVQSSARSADPRGQHGHANVR